MFTAQLTAWLNIVSTCGSCLCITKLLSDWQSNGTVLTRHRHDQLLSVNSRRVACNKYEYHHHRHQSAGRSCLQTIIAVVCCVRTSCTVLVTCRSWKQQVEDDEATAAMMITIIVLRRRKIPKQPNEISRSFDVNENSLNNFSPSICGIVILQTNYTSRKLWFTAV